MKRKISIFINIVSVLFLLQIWAHGQSLKLINGQAITVVNNVSEDISIINVSEREFEATLISTGKANPLNNKVLEKLKLKYKSIYNHARKLKTAFNLFQNGQNFYFRGSSSIPLANFQKGDVKVRCRAYLIKVRSNGAVLHIPVITRIWKI